MSYDNGLPCDQGRAVVRWGAYSCGECAKCPAAVGIPEALPYLIWQRLSNPSRQHQTRETGCCGLAGFGMTRC
jgi:hypothetical protein